MLKIPVSKLKPGMKLGRAIINAHEQVLLAEGTILSQKFINRLLKLNIPSVYIDEGFLPDVQVEDVISEKTRYRAIQLTRQIFCDSYHARSLVGLDRMESIINNIIEELLNNKNIVVNLADIRSNDEYTFGHCVNTCVLSLITAITMGYTRRQLYMLAVGAILHDLGKTLIPPEILNKPAKLNREEMCLIKKHPEYGFWLLDRNDQISKASKLAVLHHHERYNGTGYPLGLQGDQIPEFSTIVGIADMYDALTADRVYRKAFSPHEAYEMLAASGDYLFDFNVVKSFLYHITAYPVGSLIKINTGEIGVVVANRPGYSLRPRIRILFTPTCEPVIRTYEIDLAGVHTITITQVITDDAEIGRLKLKCSGNFQW